MPRLFTRETRKSIGVGASDAIGRDHSGTFRLAMVSVVAPGPADGGAGVHNLDWLSDLLLAVVCIWGDSRRIGVLCLAITRKFKLGHDPSRVCLAGRSEKA